jgi:hypothetical protein
VTRRNKACQNKYVHAHVNKNKINRDDNMVKTILLDNDFFSQLGGGGGGEEKVEEAEVEEKGGGGGGGGGGNGGERGEREVAHCDDR